MGISTDAQRSGNTSYCRSIEALTQIVMHRTMHPYKRFDFPFRFSNEYQKQQEALKVVDAFYEEIIRSKREAYSELPEEDEASKQNFLDQLLRYQENGEALSDKDIKDEINTFVLGGHDTTATALSFTLYCLARHPEVQEKILEEQEKIFGSLENEPQTTYADLQEMKYMDAVINESIRVFPPIPMIGRKLTGDIQLDSYLVYVDRGTVDGCLCYAVDSRCRTAMDNESQDNGLTLPDTMSVVCALYALHHNPKYFSDPEKFDPERFVKDEILPHTHLPFSTGPRNCIGKKFAILQIKSCISKIVRHFKLLPSVPEYDPELVCQITLASQNGIRISLQKRNR
ncbi:unnamed protein product [Acanthoscelides obtectus]|uniref:Cytochrome P450 n=1 Tax=Acanthoscelides obtectus TaxID=200917 RepID=A0A9P0Q0G6_ACAOB|nr:unnamed protein product [Acanthoscelides obtectus]CAK1663226.1 Cytochrome P450 4d2 [Acanthoscelides obtectus]